MIEPSEPGSTSKLAREGQKPAIGQSRKCVGAGLPKVSNVQRSHGIRRPLIPFLPTEKRREEGRGDETEEREEKGFFLPGKEQGKEWSLSSTIEGTERGIFIKRQRRTLRHKPKHE